MEFEITLNVTVTVRHFDSENDEPLPTEQQVVDAIENYFSGELLPYKALAECGYVTCAVETQVDNVYSKGR